jgi:DNA/RNA-binding domain of Phe-tRNA-synthetase-like protein
MADEGPRPGWVAPELAAEFPQLRLAWIEVGAAGGSLTARSPDYVRHRLAIMSDRYTGPKAVNLRQEAVPAAYRIFFRQIGIDPDAHRTPPEEVALDRMRQGGFKSNGLLPDALTIATVETSVGAMALDAAALTGDPGLRMSEPGEPLGGPDGWRVPDSQIVVADDEHALAVLFGYVGGAAEVDRRTGRAVVVAVGVKGVPEVSVEEALWTVREVVHGEGEGI